MDTDVTFPRAGEPETHQWVQLHHSIRSDVFQKPDVRRKLLVVGEKEQCTRNRNKMVILKIHREHVQDIFIVFLIENRGIRQFFFRSTAHTQSLRVV